MFPFSKLQSAMGRLRFKDESVLRAVGLAKLSKTFDAYPILEDGVKIFVLLPRGMEPVKAQKLDNVAAIKTVVVLTQGPGGVAKLWPNAEALEALKGAPAAKPAAAAPQESAAAPALDFEIVEE